MRFTILFVNLAFGLALFVRPQAPAAAAAAASDAPAAGTSEAKADGEPSAGGMPAWKLYDRALYYKNKDECKTAVTYFKSFNLATKDDPKGEAYNHLAECYIKLKQYQWAIISLKKAVKIQPDKVRYRLLLAELYLNQENNLQAYQEVEAAVKQAPRDVTVLFFSARLNLKFGKVPLAASYLRIIILESEITGQKGNIYARALLMMGNIYLSAKRYSLAQYFYEQYLPYDTNNTDLYLKLGHLSKLTGDLSKAKTFYAQAVDKEADHLPGLVSLGEVAYIEQNRKASYYISRARSILEQKGQNSLLLDALAWDLKAQSGDLKAGDLWQEADLNMNKVLARDPKNLSAAIFKLRKARREKNASDYSRYSRLSIYLANSYRLYNIARDLTWEMLDIKNGKKPALFEAGQVDLKLADAYEFLGTIYNKKKQHKRAIFAYRQSINYLQDEKPVPADFKKRSQTLHLRLIESYLAGEDTDSWSRADEAARRYLRASPGNTDVVFLRSLIKMKQGELSGARSFLSEVIAAEPEKDLYYYYYAVASELAGDKARAEQYLKLCLQKNPKNAGALNFLGYVYLEQDKFIKKAYTMIRDANQLEPDSAAYRDSLGWAYHKMDNAQNAKHHLWIAMELSAVNGREDAVIYDHLAQVLYNEQKYDYALHYWRKARRLVKKQMQGQSEDDFPMVGNKRQKILELRDRIERQIKATTQVKQWKGD